MSPVLDLMAVAERIRTLLAGTTNEVDLAASAARLRVDVQTLARSIRLDHPRPSLAVMAAIVREYGVDPSWMVYGTYDPTTHALASECGSAISPDDVLRLVDSPKYTKTDDGPEHRLLAQLAP